MILNNRGMRRPAVHESDGQQPRRPIQMRRARERGCGRQGHQLATGQRYSIILSRGSKPDGDNMDG